MAEREQQQPQAPSRPQAPVPSSVARSPAARALTLQRLAGNRVAARVLSRWVAHPDTEKKGVMVPDAAAEDYTRFNPPQNA